MTTQARDVSLQMPAHPGGFVRIQIINALRLSVTDAAQALGITRTALSRLLNERAALSPDMAIRIEKAFGLSMERLMQMQSRFDIAQARRREKDIVVARYVPRLEADGAPDINVEVSPRLAQRSRRKSDTPNRVKRHARVSGRSKGLTTRRREPASDLPQAGAQESEPGETATGSDVTPALCRKARQLLGWPQGRLAVKLQVSQSIISHYERTGEMRKAVHGARDRLGAIQAALEGAGIEFTRGCIPGVRLHPAKD